MDFYSLAHLSVPEDMTADDRAAFLEQFKGPLLRLCLTRILNQITHDPSFDVSRLSTQFYQEQILRIFHELNHGSDQFNQQFLLQQLKSQLKRNKELPDKLYRQMIKEKMISPDQQMKIDTDKKKIALIVKESNVILNNDQDPQKQEQLIELLDKSNM